MDGPNYILAPGRTSFLARLFVKDSRVGDGSGLTGLVYNATGLTCYRMRDDDGNAGASAVTLAAGTRGTWSSGGFVEKDATNAPGWYELGLPDAGQAAGSEACDYILKGAANMVATNLRVEMAVPLNFALMMIDDVGQVSANNVGSNVGVTAAWKFITNTTMADPGNGKFRFNAATVTTTTQIALSRLTVGNNDFSNQFRALKVGDTIDIQESVNAANWVKFSLNALPTDNNTWWQLPVTYIAATGTLPSGNTECSFLFTKAALPANVVQMNGQSLLQSSVFVGAAPTVTDFDTNFTVDTGANSFVAQVVYWTSGANAGRAFRITNYAYGTPTAGRVHLTVSAMPTAPASGDSFVVFGRIGG
jgi:hypothetical protein